MSDEQINFKVTDRRLFNPDGTPRDLPEEAKAEPQAAPAEERVAAAAAAQAAPSERPARDIQGDANSGTVAEQDNEAHLPGAEDPASFVNFLMSIASNAASALGMMEHPVTHRRDVDLELGKHWIDVLGMLQEKTRGNLLAQEEQILESLLADLRMQYVSLTNSPSAKTARPFTGRDIVGG